MTASEDKTLRLIIDQALADKMRDALISAEDAGAVVSACEQSGRKLVHAASGHYIGHLRRGPVTYWVEYIPCEVGSFRLLSAYSHRMDIKEE